MPLPENEAFNIQFVKVVESYKCLYDVTLPTYGLKDEQEKAWNEVARQFNSSGAECKQRWKHLRGGLTRYIKRSTEKYLGQTSKSIKQFYMWDAMQFVLPYLKPRNQSGTFPPYSPNEDNGPNDIEGDVTDDPDADSVYGFLQEVEVNPGTSSSNPTSSITRKRTNSFRDESFERIVSKYILSPEKVEDPNLQFFKSILPDMATLNPSQTRRFKQKVLQLLDDFCNEGTAAGPGNAFSSN